MIDSVIDGRYWIIRSIGAGGMGAVYEAAHTGTGRRVAVKLINIADLNKSSNVVGRFHREAKAAGAIDTQHIAQVLDLGTDPTTGDPYMVMELLVGEDLQQLLQRLGPLHPNLALRIAAQACIGLQKAHEAQVVRRDIKPANVFLAKRDVGEHVVKLLDFGIAKMKVDLAYDDQSPDLTRTGSILGSPLYMSPEQARGSKLIDHRTDIWSLGIVFYQLLTGQAPNREIAAFGELIIAICHDAPKPVQELAPWVPHSVAAIVHRAIQMKASERFQTAQEMFEAIRALLPHGWAITDGTLVPGSGDAGHVVADLVPSSPVAVSFATDATMTFGEATGRGESSPAIVRISQDRPTVVEVARQATAHSASHLATSSPMGRIERQGSGEIFILRSQMLLGRSAACDLRINEPRVSSEHARLRWTGTTWEVRDLGSKNGTFVGGRRLAAGDRAALIVGDTVGLGGAGAPAPVLVLVDASAPATSARSERTGVVRFASGGLLTLPDDEHPEISVVEGREGKWTIETGDMVREVSESESITVGDETWVLDVPSVAVSTMAAESVVLMLESIEMRFVVSADEKNVALTVVSQGKEIPLPSGPHHHLLVVLARERLLAAGVPSAERGWVDRQLLCQKLGTNEQRLNVEVLGARREFAALGIQGAANVIERSSGALRLGVERVNVTRAA
jgi:serine/threonine protein kinase